MIRLARAQLVFRLEMTRRTPGGMAMIPLITDALWRRLQPLLPPPPRRRFRFPGRKPLDYRKVLTGLDPVGGKPGPKRQKPDRLQGDRGYDSEPVRRLLRWLGITPVLAERNTEHGSGLGVFRWFVERTISWLH